MSPFYDLIRQFESDLYAPWYTCSNAIRINYMFTTLQQYQVKMVKRKHPVNISQVVQITENNSNKLSRIMAFSATEFTLFRLLFF